MKENSKPEMKAERITTALDTRFIRVYGYPLDEDKQYLVASRRKKEDLVMVKPEEEYKRLIPDAVTCAVILEFPGEEPRLLMNYEFRYAAGNFIMAPPAGLIDPEDMNAENPLIETAKREIKEETGLTVQDSDDVFVVNQALFSSPGMTDESNGIACAVIRSAKKSDLTHEGCEETEVFGDFELLTKEAAKSFLKTGADKYGNPYSVYTWICLMCFVSDLWK